MDIATGKGPHFFHIPVVGTGFSIDTPLKVARYGISSAISLGDDLLIEQMRKFHCDRLGLQYTEISDSNEDTRANRVTAYLNLLDELIRDQVKVLKSSPFELGSEITRYFEMLPDSPLKESYTEMLAATDATEQERMQEALRLQVVPGSIDVNIMTKLNRDVYKKGVKLAPEFCDAMASLRGYSNSLLQSSIIFSAGINPRLFGYLAKFDDFFPDETGFLKKRIVLKVSDFRSALIQGKYLAKRGLWVSEYRVESGLNCGGHAFATEGFLMGPILEEFGKKKAEFVSDLHKVYNKSLANADRAPIVDPHEVLITVQGGIGTADENRFLLDKYGVDSTGWGTPFMLVPEVTNVDDEHLKKLSDAEHADVFLSGRSPLGVPFWSLRNSLSEHTHGERITAGRPGSPCPKGLLKFNTEFTEVPICRASRNYQRRKLEELSKLDPPEVQLNYKRESVLAKACICHDLAGGATLKLGIDQKATPAVCCGPNIINFSKIATLEEMVSHIYGRISLLTDPDRPHMFVKELSLYVDYLRQELQETSEGLIDKTAKCLQDVKQNLNSGIEHYRNIAEQFGQEQKEKFLNDLEVLFEEIEKILPEATSPASLGIVSQ